MNDIVIKEESMKDIISKLDLEINKLESIYNELDSKVSCINESSDIWSGDCQKKAYDNYLSISSDFPNIVNQMKSLKIFLENTLNNYLNSDKVLNDSIENNKDDLDV